MREFYKLNN